MRGRSAGRLAAAMVITWGCSSPGPRASGPAWLASDPDERAVQLERHLRGLDVAMIETGYRYAELVFAARDANWDAAAYQVDKIRLALENAIERRPKRAPTTRAFLDGPLAATREAVVARDPEQVAERLEVLTVACNACHAAEQVAFFEVKPPEVRVSPVRPDGSAREEGRSDP